LRKAGLVSDRKEGLWIYYQLNNDLPEWVIAVLKTTVEGIKTSDPYVRDANELNSMSNRPGIACSA
jgi:ArsR family transcriptional regulator